MRILALDTATRATAVALWLPPEDPVELRDDPPRGARPRHTTRVLALIAELLERRDADWEEIDKLAVGIGPGTFTGLRVGIATARALAAAREIPLAAVSTLESLATNASLASAGVLADGAAHPRVRTVMAVLDARRGEAFAAAWRLRERESARSEAGTAAVSLRSTPSAAVDPAALGERVLEPAALSPERLAIAATELGPAVLGIGEGALEFRTALERAGVVVPQDHSELHTVSAACHCRLARDIAGGPPAEVRPAYLRKPDAEIALGQR